MRAVEEGNVTPRVAITASAPQKARCAGVINASLTSGSAEARAPQRAYEANQLRFLNGITNWNGGRPFIANISPPPGVKNR
jgi:hypothetical protein